MVKDVTPVSPLYYEPMSPKNPKLLRNTRMSDAESLCEPVYIDLTAPEFFNDTNTIGVSKNPEELGELFTDKCPSRHNVIFKCLHICTGLSIEPYISV